MLLLGRRPQIIIHGIDQVLFPDGVQAAMKKPTAQEASKAGQAPANIKAATSTAAARKADDRSSGRTLLAKWTADLANYVSSLRINGKDPAHPLPRRLQQFGSSVSGISLNSVAVTSTQSSIRAAVDGVSSANDAASAGIWNSRSASVRCFNCITQSDVGDWGR